MHRGALLLLPLSLLAACGVTDTAPPNAVLYADPDSHQVVSPPCKAAAPAAYSSFTQRITDADVRAAWKAWRKDQSVRPYFPDIPCGQRRFRRPGFSPAGSSGGFTEGRLPLVQKPTRWNPDGSWNW